MVAAVGELHGHGWREMNPQLEFLEPSTEAQPDITMSGIMNNRSLKDDDEEQETNLSFPLAISLFSFSL